MRQRFLATTHERGSAVIGGASPRELETEWDTQLRELLEQ